MKITKRQLEDEAKKFYAVANNSEEEREETRDFLQASISSWARPEAKSEKDQGT